MSPLTNFLAAAALAAGAWVATWAIHATLLLGAAAVADRLALRRHPAAAELAWRLALVGSLLSATLTVSGAITTPLRVAPGVRTEERRDVLVVRGADARALRLERVDTSRHVDSAGLLLATLGGVWLVVAGWRVGETVQRRRRLGRLLAGRSPLDVAELPAAAAEWLQRRRGRRLDLTLHRALLVPVALGRREVCLPERALRELGGMQLRAVLAHEAAHLDRGDPLHLAALELLVALLPPHPLVTRGAARLRECAELAADDSAAASTSAPRTLARTIAQVAGWPGEAGLTTFAGEPSPFVRRVERLLIDPVPRGRYRVVVAVVALLSLAAVAMKAPSVAVWQQNQARVVKMLAVEEQVDLQADKD